MKTVNKIRKKITALVLLVVAIALILTTMRCTSARMSYQCSTYGDPHPAYHRFR